jgi:probable rRNA maturation factor
MRAPSRSEVVVNGGGAGMATATIRAVVEHVLRAEHRHARIGVTFLGKARMRRLNASSLGHDVPTDVISFALPQPDGSVAGDICVCRYVAARNAREHGSTVRAELLRLVVHGTLHVLGYDHPEGSARLRSPMWRRQERYVARLQ